MYEIVGWVGFVVTDFVIKGSKDNEISGYFTQVVWEGNLQRGGGARRLRCARAVARRMGPNPSGQDSR